MKQRLLKLFIGFIVPFALVWLLIGHHNEISISLCCINGTLVMLFEKDDIKIDDDDNDNY